MLDLLFPKRCVLCESAGAGLCARCAAMLTPPAANAAIPLLDELVAICSYEGAGRALVLALKRGNRRAAVPVLGFALAEAVLGVLRSRPDRDAFGVTWAPTTPQRARARGFDQAELLARAVAGPLRSRSRPCLRRSGDAQMGRSAQRRHSNPAFTARRAIEGTWVLIDDVVTTGSTMTGAACALREAGASSVVGAAIAVTPAHRPL